MHPDAEHVDPEGAEREHGDAREDEERVLDVRRGGDERADEARASLLFGGARRCELYAGSVTATPPADDPSGAGAGDADAARRAETEARSARWARRAADRIPTGWIVTSAGAVLLGATAAFGGLEPAPKPEPIDVETGEHYLGSQLDMVVLSAAVGRPTSDSDDDARSFVIVMDVTNEHTAPRLASAADTMGGVGVEGLRLGGVEVSRVDDGSSVLQLQPGVPTRVELTWTVEQGAVAAGEEVRVVLPDSTRFEGSFVTRGTYWDDVRPGAHVGVRVDELVEDDA